MKINLLKTLSIVFLISVLSACKDKIIESIPVQFSDVSSSNITEFSAQVAASITKSGSQEITEHGFAISKTSDEPTVDQTSIKKGAIDITTPVPISFSGSFSSLEPNSEYSVRTYATTASGTVYGKTAKFKTLDISQPGVRTDGTEAVSHNSAKLNAAITGKGTHAITEYGIVWGTTASPTTSLTTKTSTKANVTQFPTAFSANASGLAANTTYNYRAYVISNGVTSYGDNKTFKTSDLVQPTIRTDSDFKVSETTATVWGTLTAKGSNAITEYGICWNTSANPTTSNSKKTYTGDVTSFPKQFEAFIENLNPATTYNFRAYVIMGGVTTYGDNKTFKTSDLVQPSIRTDSEAKAGETVATVWGTLTAKGSSAISEYGICWNTAANPTTSNSKKAYMGNVTSFPKQFDAYMENLKPGTTYHFRAYVIMGGVTTYGDNKSFKTSVSEPRVTTGDIFSITGRGTVMTGTVNSKGSFDISEIGIVYGETQTPTTANTKVSKSGSGITYPHNFEFSVQGFSGTGAIYYRAYVISNGVTYYGDAKLGRAVSPVLQSGTHSLSGAVYTLRGTISNRPTHAIREYGIVWARSNVSKTPTTAHNKLSTTLGTTTIIATFPHNFSKTVNISSLGSCQGISFRAYCITSDGRTHYSTNVTEFGTPGCIN